jgi:hypothetical protein
MPCYRPLRARFEPHPSGGRRLVFAGRSDDKLFPHRIPCGQCIGCRVERSQMWATRCVHEASQHADNCFLTLTYAPEHLPPWGDLVKKDLQDFLKRLRKKVFKETGRQIRFYACGEYGPKLSRPHYHVIIFGYDFADKVRFKMTGGVTSYTSEILEELWGKGFCTLGAVTRESAAYTARYVIKKMNGDLAEDHYSVIDPHTGEIHVKPPEFTQMSLRPGIGASWFKRYRNDVYPHGHVVFQGGVKARAPRYYDILFERKFPATMAVIKDNRVKNAQLKFFDNTKDRLKVREQVATARLKQAKRGYEDG